MKRIAVTLSIAILLSVSALGCSSSAPGTASPAPNIDESSGNSTTRSPGTASATVEITDPCTLLSPTEASEFGDFQDPEIKAENNIRSCVFLPERTLDGGSRASLGVGVRESSVDNVKDRGLGSEQATLNGRDAARIPDPNGACIVALALTHDSRVDVGVIGINHEDACELVEQVADIVEPKLPEQR